jgi:nanoRNase/pAp phosphatase (c-di-AMP/oligoRNAs hydrolase)
MLEYGGGGHEKVGTCQIMTQDWERTLREIVQRMQSDVA